MYADDNRDSYPVTTGWGDFGGQRGTPTPTTQWLVPYFGIYADYTNRPLNKYVAVDARAGTVRPTRVIPTTAP